MLSSLKPNHAPIPYLNRVNPIMLLYVCVTLPMWLEAWNMTVRFFRKKDKIQ